MFSDSFKKWWALSLKQNGMIWYLPIYLTLCIHVHNQTLTKTARKSTQWRSEHGFKSVLLPTENTKTLKETEKNFKMCCWGMLK